MPIILVAIGIAVALFLLVFAAMVVIPVGALAVGGYFLYRHMQLQKLRTAAEHVPATIRERPTHLTPEAFFEEIDAERLFESKDEEEGKHSCPSLIETFKLITVALYEAESFEQPPIKPDTNDRITLARYQDTLEEWQRKVSDKKNIKLLKLVSRAAYLTLRDDFPSYAFSLAAASKLTTPFSFTDEEDATQQLISVYFDPQVKERKMFVNLRKQVEQNSEGRDDYKFFPYFAGTPYTLLRHVQIPITLPDETRFAGMWVIAPQGRGKTTLLHSLVAQDLERDASIILMDSKGELIEPFLRLSSIRNRLVIIGPDNPVGINPLDIPKTDINKAVDSLEYVFSSLLEFKLSPTQSMLLKAVLRALITVFDKPTLETFRDILANGTKQYEAEIAKLESDLQDFFRKEFTTDNIRSRRQEVLQRLRLLLDNDTMRKMLLAPLTTFHIGQAMDEGKVIIIDNSKGKLGEQAAEFLGRFFIAQVLAAAQERSFRPRSGKTPVFFYIDEAQSVIARDEKITTVLHECRSQNIALILAHQETTQLNDYVLSAVQNCAIRFANPDDEAPKLTRSLRLTLDTLRKLKRGQFAAYIRDLSQEGLVINVERTDFSQLAQLPPPVSKLGSPQTHEPPPFDDGSRENENAPAQADDVPSISPKQQPSRSDPLD